LPSSVSIELLGEVHADAVLHLAGDPELSWTSSVPAACSASNVVAWIDDNDASPRTCLTFAILEQRRIVGVVTLKRLDAADNSGELAFWVGREHRGQGLARQAARLVLDYAFDRLHLDYVHAHCLRDGNPASRRDTGVSWLRLRQVAGRHAGGRSFQGTLQRRRVGFLSPGLDVNRLLMRSI
jgi:hypothetical protein